MARGLTLSLHTEILFVEKLLSIIHNINTKLGKHVEIYPKVSKPESAKRKDADHGEKKSKPSKRDRVFNPDWLKEFEWLNSSTEKSTAARADYMEAEIDDF